MVVRAERIVAVRGAGQGSGYLLTPRLFLTAAHVVRSDPWANAPEAVEAAVPGGRGWVRGSVVWMPAAGSQHLDAALVRTEEDLVDRAGAALTAAEVRWGRIDGLQPVPRCHLTGYPAAARDDRGRLDSTQVAGTLMPGSGLLSHRLVLAGDHTPPAAVPGAASPWAGVSGAGVLFRDRLMGLAVEDRQPGTWQHAQLSLVPVADLLAVAGFAEALAEHGVPRPRLEGVSDQEADDADFEQRYAESVRVDHGKLRIFGLDLSRARSRLSDLDTAYLGLEAKALPQEGAVRAEQRPERVEAVLRGRSRILLRGQAGSGKTTLVQWLAVHAAEGSLGEALADWNHRVPFVLRLRAMYRLRNLHPRPEEYLGVESSPLAGAQPPGWADRVLRAGRALLLVDGMDEIPEQERDEAREWLGRVLGHYPQTLCVVTVRPSAVATDWLAHLGFEEMTLCPMQSADRETLIDRWHAAAQGELEAGPPKLTPRESQELGELKEALKRALRTSPDLATLTDSPLLCAMICALHRDWDGALPRRKMDVYEAALNMLLVRRDQQRRVEDTDGLRLNREEQLALLQRIAAWLVSNGMVEGTRADAVRQIERLLPALSASARAATAEQVYSYLINRAGLLSETSVDTFEFLHRTFQDYLAAAEFTEDRAFGMLSGRAGDEQWSDVVRMTVGHSSPKDRADLLRRLLAAAQEASEPDRLTILVLAGSCLSYAPRLEAEVRAAVLERIASLLHEQTEHLLDRHRYALALVGEDLLELIPRGRERPLEFGWLIAAVGGDRALARLAEIAAEVTPEDAGFLSNYWSSFDADRFARTVLAVLPLEKVALTVHDADQFKALAALGRIHRVTCYLPEWPFPRKGIGPVRVRHLCMRIPPSASGPDLFLRASDFVDVETVEFMFAALPPVPLDIGQFLAGGEFQVLAGVEGRGSVTLSDLVVGTEGAAGRIALLR
ncbi:NACHT domain-containing protein [Kitasatospora sp. NBC_00240]|uniref:NACHT domain-containing protein n=1 Tax=Kitasatospora sp. NBC_00240 TaxID=2903567 RepID=UPI0022542E53|nr:NACHT domain-containing protein [Kitasatospora sp. NBC_00240]MCX5212189.1 NACHT domain-containing protein [Kitasatospora sp. NBC_00240]